MGDRVVFENVKLVDGKHATRAGSHVVVEGNRIAAVGSGPATLAGDRVVDLRGRVVMPGMAICHFHPTYGSSWPASARPIPAWFRSAPAYTTLVAVTHLELALQCGFTSAVSAGGVRDIEPVLAAAIDAGFISGPRFLPGGPDLSGTGSFLDIAPSYGGISESHMYQRCDGLDEFCRAVREQVRQGARVIKLAVSGGHGALTTKDRLDVSEAELRAAVETAHERGALIRGHIVSKRAILAAIEAGIDIIDHGDDIDDECIAALVEHGTFLAPSIHFAHVFFKEMLESPRVWFDRADTDHMLEMLPIANAAGVKLLIGDDYASAPFSHGRYAEELEVYVRDAGIPPVDVLRWATVHGAEVAGRGNELGTIEEGKLADLLVIDGDPLDDITVLQDRDNLIAIMKDGVFAKDELAGICSA
jgi:imidazolonepropionase-like amidohydrolase